MSRLLGKLPHDLQSSFRRFIYPLDVKIPTLLEFSDWLEYEIQVQEDSTRYASHSGRGYSTRSSWDDPPRKVKSFHKGTEVLLGTEKYPSASPSPVTVKTTMAKPYCPYCDNNKYSLNNCANFSQLSKFQMQNWKGHNRCWRCGRSHRSAECNLKMCCKACNGHHLLVLHEVNARSRERTVEREDPSASPIRGEAANNVLFIDKPPGSRKVLLKICKVILRNGDQSMKAYTILDDGSERSILLHTAASQLKLKGKPEDLPLRTVRQELKVCMGRLYPSTFHQPVSQTRYIQSAELSLRQSWGLECNVILLRLYGKGTVTLKNFPSKRLKLRIQFCSLDQTTLI